MRPPTDPAEDGGGVPGAAPRLRYGLQDRAAAFAEFLRRHAGERHIAVMQDYPDPDAISSALAYRLLAGRHGIETDIVYAGHVSHQENLALVQVLDIALIRFGDEVDLARFDGAIYIDNQGTTTRLTDPLAAAGVPALAILDHHAPQDVLEPELADIRPIGAAATILTDYLQSGRVVELDAGDAEHVRLATALVHGLRSETNGFTRAGPEEYAAGAYLSRFKDPELLEAILKVQRSRGTMDVIRIALTDRIVRDGFCIAGVGYLRHADRDAIPQATDFLLTEEDVHTAIVFGILEGEGEREVVVGSVRTARLTMDVDRYLKAALGADARGRYYGGGRSRAGGFEIPVGFPAGGAAEDPMELKWDAFHRQIEAKLLRAAGVAEDDGGRGGG
jgi:nanoRNase/pAp phosphatase (c-di-AMP/oligoRNAs hydrolase)